MDGLRFERRGEDDYYKVLLHIGSTFVPISDEDVEELKKQSAIFTRCIEQRHVAITRVFYTAWWQ